MKRHRLKDDQWKLLAPLLPLEKGRVGRPVQLSNRNVVEALLWLGKTGAPWRDLPDTFDPWQSVYSRFRRWPMSGVWEDVFAELADPDVESVILDSTIVRARQHASGEKMGVTPKA